MIGFNLANYGTLKVDFERKRYRNRILNITSAYLSPEEEGGLVGPSKVVQMFALIGLSEQTWSPPLPRNPLKSRVQTPVYLRCSVE